MPRGVSDARVPAIDHLVFMVRDLAATRRFYDLILGEPHHAEDEQLVYHVGGVRVFFAPSDLARPEASRDAVGFNHLAFGVADRAGLDAIVAALDDAGHVHSAVIADTYGGHDFVWLDDPDGMRVELYLRA